MPTATHASRFASGQLMHRGGLVPSLLHERGERNRHGFSPLQCRKTAGTLPQLAGRSSLGGAGGQRACQQPGELRACNLLAGGIPD